MLLRFSCENFLSFGDRVDFHLTAVPEETSHPHHLRRPVESRKEQALRVAAIYGANASGKTNLYKALHYARWFVYMGLHFPMSKFSPFKFQEEAQKAPSVFEFLISLEGRLYEYGFAVTREVVLEEWLYDQTKEDEEEMLFERVTNGREVHFELGPRFEMLRSDGSEKIQGDFQRFGWTSPNELLFRLETSQGIQELKSLFEWFSIGLRILCPMSGVNRLPHMLSFNPSPEFKRFAKEFLSRADTGICDIDIRESIYVPKEEEEDSSLNTQNRPYYEDSYRDLDFETPVFKRNEGEFKKYDIVLYQGESGNQKEWLEFNLSEQSSGTLQLAVFLPYLFMAKTGQSFTLVVDELDKSLHPLLTRQIIDFFLSQTNSDSQLIFTTHETSLLDLDLLRRDEIWFVEKDKAQSSRLYSLVEFKPRKDLRIDKGYLHGRFGAIPFLGDPSWLEMCDKPTDVESPEDHK